MSQSFESIAPRVIRVVAEALDHPTSAIKPWSSLLDDLGAESIDFLDIAFRLESEFDIKINSEELWAGKAGKLTAEADVQAEIARLRARMPEYPWDRLPAKITRAELPRLITVQTIVDYVARRLEQGTEQPAAE